MNIETAYQILYKVALICFLLLIAAVLIRSVIGPRITDRILSINMLGTMVISSIAILSRMLEETYLLDVAIIYTMISFITVLMMATMYIPKDPTREKFPSQMHLHFRKTGTAENVSEKTGRSDTKREKQAGNR